MLYETECFEIIGLCMKVHRKLGHGFLESVYKDALEIEFNLAGVPYIREHEFKIDYFGHFLKTKFYADFTVYESIILEAKAISGIPDELYARTINNLKVSNMNLGLIVNFGKPSLEYKRVIQTK